MAHTCRSQAQEERQKGQTGTGHSVGPNEHFTLTVNTTFLPLLIHITLLALRCSAMLFDLEEVSIQELRGEEDRELRH